MSEHSTPEPTGFVKLQPSALIRDLDGETVLLNLQTELYFSLDEVGARLLALARSLPSLDATVDAALQEFDTDADTLGQDLRALLDELEDAGLITRA